jgi:hypothetical protein
MLAATALGRQIAGGQQQQQRGQEFGENVHGARAAVIMMATGPLQTGSAAALGVRTMTRAPAGGGHGGSTLVLCS